MPTVSPAWSDWRWQQRAAVRTAGQLREVFAELDDADADSIDSFRLQRRFQATQHFLSLIKRVPGRDAPDPGDPLWLQIRPALGDASVPDAYRYDGTENWELPDEMVTPVAQHKYPDRVIVRASNVCHSYCQFCYEALRTLEKDSDKPAIRRPSWDSTLAYVEAHPEVEEVILSGGEPLMQSDAHLDRMLADLRTIGRPLAIRIHTRTLTFNPFRVTEDLCSVLAAHGVNAVGVHVAHPNEVAEGFELAVGRLSRAVPILFANIPLLRGINEQADVIRTLSLRLYRLGVARGYLYHFMPHSPGAHRFRTPVREGVDIVASLKRTMSNLAVPEYVLPHASGKHTMPLLREGEEPASWVVDDAGNPVVRYVNWQGVIVDYPDPAVIPLVGKEPVHEHRH